MNTECYSLEELHLPKGLFEECVDAAYVLTMTNSQRDYRSELDRVSPHSRVWVQHNPGYKACAKILNGKQSPNNDLVDSHLNVFGHANDHGYANILVFEDDFQLVNQLPGTAVPDVVEFVKSGKGDMYNLGPVAYISGTPFRKHQHCSAMGCMHAVIYNRKVRDAFSSAMESQRYRDMQLERIYSRLSVDIHAYKQPIYAQTFPSTDNSKQTWDTPVIRKAIEFAKLDTSIDNFTKVSKGFRWSGPVILLLILLAILAGLRLTGFV